ncbi:MAG: type II toxin-antitoxin system VapC family toxin [Candidatus Aenigmarchaeota archaeon]|nr:type II toxin-antitoxin system VapC family toxin [Candidatus Aenigmarchaeota archaeon]
MVKLIVIDSNVWIFAETAAAPEHFLAVAKLQRYLKDGVGFNAIIFSEVFHKLSRAYDPATARKRLETIVHHPSVKWLNIDEDQAERAAELAQKKVLRINDAMIAQQAIDMNLSVLTDDAKDFGKVERLKVIALR